MKTSIKKLLLTCSLLVAYFANAQTPNGMNYQATVRDNTGDLLKNENINIEFSILKNSINGTVVYSESQSSTTNNFGGFSSVIGDGTAIVGLFNDIKWSENTHFLNVKVNGNDLGTSQLMSVPYAQHAKTADGITNPNWKNKLNTIYNLKDRVVIGDSIFDANKLTVKETKVYASELVDFKVDSLLSGSDILNLSINEAASYNTQFIECKNQGILKFAVNENGTTVIGNELHTPSTLDDNLIPKAYGNINSSGNINSNASTSNFTVVKTSIGAYEISINSNYYTSSNFNSLVTLSSSIGFVRYGSYQGKLKVFTYNTSGIASDRPFNFIVYKP